MSDQIQLMITNFGFVVVACLPLIGLYVKKVKDNKDELSKTITAVVAAVAVFVGSVFAVWNARHQAAVEQQNKIESVKALSGVSPEHKEERAKFLGVAPPKS